MKAKPFSLKCKDCEQGIRADEQKNMPFTKKAMVEAYNCGFADGFLKGNQMRGD